LRTRRSRRGVGGLDRGVEFDRVAALLARAVARAFAPAERHMVVDPGGRQVDHHETRLRVALEIARVLQRSGADAPGQAERAVVGDRKRLLPSQPTVADSP